MSIYLPHGWRPDVDDEPGEVPRRVISLDDWTVQREALELARGIFVRPNVFSSGRQYPCILLATPESGRTGYVKWAAALLTASKSGRVVSIPAGSLLDDGSRIRAGTIQAVVDFEAARGALDDAAFDALTRWFAGEGVDESFAVRLLPHVSWSASFADPSSFTGHTISFVPTKCTGVEESLSCPDDLALAELTVIYGGRGRAKTPLCFAIAERNGAAFLKLDEPERESAIGRTSVLIGFLNLAILASVTSAVADGAKAMAIAPPQSFAEGTVAGSRGGGNWQGAMQLFWSDLTAAIAKCGISVAIAFNSLSPEELALVLDLGSNTTEVLWVDEVSMISDVITQMMHIESSRARSTAELRHAVQYDRGYFARTRTAVTAVLAYFDRRRNRAVGPAAGDVDDPRSRRGRVGAPVVVGAPDAAPRFGASALFGSRSKQPSSTRNRS